MTVAATFSGHHRYVMSVAAVPPSADYPHGGFLSGWVLIPSAQVFIRSSTAVHHYPGLVATGSLDSLVNLYDPLAGGDMGPFMQLVGVRGPGGFGSSFHMDGS